MGILEITAMGASFVLGVCGVATIFMNGFVKASRITSLEEQIKELWNTVRGMVVIQTKLEYVEKSVDEIKNLLKEVRHAQ